MDADQKIALEDQSMNAAKLVLGAFYRIVKTSNGATAADIANYLQDKFGDVWRKSALTAKAEEALSMAAALGFLRRDGELYMIHVARDMEEHKPATVSRRRSRGCGCRGVRKAKKQSKRSSYHY